MKCFTLSMHYLIFLCLLLQVYYAIYGDIIYVWLYSSLSLVQDKAFLCWELSKRIIFIFLSEDLYWDQAQKVCGLYIKQRYKDGLIKIRYLQFLVQFQQFQDQVLQLLILLYPFFLLRLSLLECVLFQACPFQSQD